MAHEIRRVDHFFLSIPIEPGHASALLSSLKDEGVGFYGFWTYSPDDRSVVVEMVPEDSRKFHLACERRDLRPSEGAPCFHVTGQGPGAVVQVMETLRAAGIAVGAVHPCESPDGRYGALVFLSGSDAAKAAVVLSTDRCAR